MFRKKHTSTGLLDSKLFNEDGFYKAFSKDFKQAKSEVIIESPFITKRRASELAALCKRLTGKWVK